MTTDIALNIVLLSFMAITGLAIARLRNLFPVAMLTGLYSLLSASLLQSTLPSPKRPSVPA